MKINTIIVGVDNCYLIQGRSTILIDGGTSGKFNSFTNGVESLGIDPDEIETIIITHSHWDHIGCARQIKEVTGAKVMVHKNEKSVIENGEFFIPPPLTTWGSIIGVLISNWGRKFQIEPCKVDIVIEDDLSLEQFGINGKAIFTPGHSPGSVTVLLDTGEAFVGDLAMNQFPLTLRPSFPIFGMDESVLIKSWKKLINMGAEKIYPAHGKPFTVEKLIKKYNL